LLYFNDKMNNFAQYIDKCQILNMHLCYAEWLTFKIVYFKNVAEKFDCLMALEKLVILLMPVMLLQMSDC
jgi:hypothetical protein